MRMEVDSHDVLARDREMDEYAGKIKCDEMDVDEEVRVGDGSSSKIAAFSLQDLPTDAMNVALSFLTFDEFKALSILSKSLYIAVGKSCHLFARQSCCLSTRSRRQLALRGPSPASEMYSPLIASAGDNATSEEVPILPENNGSPAQLSPLSPFLASTNHPGASWNSFASDLTSPQLGFYSLLQRFQNLSVLSLGSGLASVGDRLISLLNASPSASTLRSVALHGCALSYWCHEPLRLPNVKILSITGSNAIRVSFSKLLGELINLEHLEIGQSTSLRDDTIGSLGLRMPFLRTLTLRQCVRLRRPIIQFPSLMRLSLAGCFSLTGFPNFSCPQVYHLDLSFCVRIRVGELYDCLQRMPHLEQLKLIECISLQSLRVSSPSLTHLNVGYCSSLEFLELDCPSLQKLENVSCLSLSKLRLHRAPHLCRLDLSFLTRLCHVEVDAPGLEILGLENCRRLEVINTKCPTLRAVKVRGSKMTAHRFNAHIRRTMVRGWTAAALGDERVMEAEARM